MGLTLLKQLAKMGDKYVVSMVNRGNNYWDRESSKVVQGAPNVIRHCMANRKDPEFEQKVIAHIAK